MPGKFKIVVSDLHLSAGHEAEGNPLEDFGSEQQFADLLDRSAAESQQAGAEVELIINGDAFEMLQVPNVDTFDPTRAYPPEEYHSSSEEDSALKMAIIVGGHPGFFEALRRFTHVGPPRRYVTFIKGNHDLNLHWLAVQDLIREAMGATGEEVPLLTFEERRISREGIYVEHGNQYAEAVDRIPDMEEPHDHDRPGQLSIPLGSWFVMDVFNDVERQKYWIDGVKPITALVWYALAFDFPFAARAIATLIRRLPGIIKEGLFEVEESRANALARLLEDPEGVKQTAARYQTDETFRLEFNAEVARTLAPPPEIPGAEAIPLPAVADPVVMGERLQSRVHSSLFTIAQQRAAEEGVSLVTFGHTHDASEEELPGGGVYINSGTWTWRADFGDAGKETWQDLFEHPERFTGDRLLTYVRIDYDADGQPAGRLMTYEPAPPPEPEKEPPEPEPVKPQPEPVKPEPEPVKPEEQAVSFWDRLVGWLGGLFGPR
jgi:UDP-2,3-diacylglucosamine pyrophosphatase LpxH